MKSIRSVHFYRIYRWHSLKRTFWKCLNHSKNIVHRPLQRMLPTLKLSKRAEVHVKAWIYAIKVSWITFSTFQMDLFPFYLITLTMFQYSAENQSIIDLDGSDKIVATTKVLIPQGDGPIEATSTIEAVPNSALYTQFNRIDCAERPYDNVKKDVKKTPEPFTTPQKDVRWKCKKIIQCQKCTTIARGHQ